MANNLMNEQELHEFGLQVVVNWLEQHGNTIEFVQPGKHDLPNIVVKNGQMLTFILVAVDMYPKKGTVSEADKALVLQHAEQMGALTACARVGLANAYGVEKQDKAMMSTPDKNARFLIDFSGLEYIQFES